jgi:hypothetical protein
MPQFDLLSFFNQLTWFDFAIAMGYITTALYLIPKLSLTLKFEQKLKIIKGILANLVKKVTLCVNFFNSTLKSIFSQNFSEYLLNTIPFTNYLATYVGSFNIKRTLKGLRELLIRLILR